MKISQNRFSWVLVFGLLLTACSTVGAYQRASSGELGCPASEISISDESAGLGAASWTASCRGKTLYCSSTGHAGTVKCSEPRAR